MPGLAGLHVLQQPAYELAHELGPQRPAVAPIAVHPGHVGHAGEHHSAIAHRLGKVHRTPVHRERYVAHDRQLEARGGDDHVTVDAVPGLQLNALFVELRNVIGDHGRLACADGLEQVTVRHKGHALLQRLVRGREMPLHVVALGQARLDAGDELLLEGVRVGSRALDQVGPIPHDLAAHDLVDPCLVDFQLAQLIGQCIGIAAGGEIRGRALQHGDVRTTVGKRRYEGRRRRPRADHGHALAGEIDRIGPMLRMHNLTLELLKPRPGGCISLAMPVVALAHPEKARLDLHRFPGVVHGKVQRPGAGRTGP